jgi:hypothetical protein
VVLGAALLSATTLSVAGPALAAQTTDTITVTCTNGWSRTVSANAARGVAKALTAFNAHNHKSATCTAGPGAPRPAPAAAWLHITCTDGFERTVNAKAAGPIVKALNAYSARKNLGVTCSAS